MNDALQLIAYEFAHRHQPQLLEAEVLARTTTHGSYAGSEDTCELCDSLIRLREALPRQHRTIMSIAVNYALHKGGNLE